MKSSVLFIDGAEAVVRFDARVEMMRGEFLNTGGEARFMAADVKELKIAARDALESYRFACKRAGVKPFSRRHFTPLQRLKSWLH